MTADIYLQIKGVVMSVFNKQVSISALLVMMSVLPNVGYSDPTLTAAEQKAIDEEAQQQAAEAMQQQVQGMNQDAAEADQAVKQQEEAQKAQEAEEILGDL
jgi:hypothetical protein